MNRPRFSHDPLHTPRGFVKAAALSLVIYAVLGALLLWWLT